MPSRFKKIRRKLLGLIFGCALGGTASLYSSRSQAGFGGSFVLSDEDLFEMFLENAGGVFMRFLGNRFISNLQNAYDDYSEENKEQTEKNNADTAAMIAQGSDAQVKVLKEIWDHQLSLEAMPPKSLCITSELSSAGHKISRATRQASSVTTQKGISYLERNQDSVGSQSATRASSISTLLSENKKVRFLELTSLIGSGHFNDTNRAEEELLMLLSDIANRSSKTENTIESIDAIHSHAIKASQDIILNALMHIFMQRTKAIDVPESLRDSLSPELKSTYNSKLSYIEFLELEVLSKSNNRTFNEEVYDTPSTTTGSIVLSQLNALTSKLHHERLLVQEQRNIIQSLKGMLN